MICDSNQRERGQKLIVCAMFVGQFSSLICLVDVVVVVVVVVVVNVLDEQYHKGGRGKTGDLRQGNQTPRRQNLKTNLKAPQHTVTPCDGIEKKSSLN